MQKSWLMCIAIVFVTVLSVEPSRAANEPKFLRFVPDDTGGGKLEVASVRYRNAEGITVDLVGAVHIADADYFKDLNDSFTSYDSVLYEMVKPRDAAPASKRAATTRPTARRPSGLRWVGTLQQFMKNTLGLKFQLEEIDYDRPNFVHADLDAESFLEMQEQRGESFLKLMIQAMVREMARGGANAAEPNLGELIFALQAPDRPRQLKLVLARQFEQMDDIFSGLDGPKGSVILTERNKVALNVLKNRMAAGDRKIAIFYGAGHLKGMEKILTSEMGFKQIGEPQWRTAWDMTSIQPATQPAMQR